MEYINRCQTTQARLVELAQQHQARRLEYRSRKGANKTTDFAPQQLILLAPPQEARPPDKLSPKLTGPFEVTGKRGDRLNLRSLVDGREFEVHSERARPFFDCKTDPLHLATKTHNREYLIDDIIAHRLATHQKRPN